MDTEATSPRGNNGAGAHPAPEVRPRSEIGVSNHVVKVIEVLAESSSSWEDAVRVALREASRSVRGISSIYIKDMQAIVRDGHVAAWRVNAKLSFVVASPRTAEANAESRELRPNTGEEVMRRHPDQGRRPWRNDRGAFPDYEEYGLRGGDRREYRGRESYEQQTRGGEGGRSGMWDHRFVPRDLDEPYRNNADEDRRGYRNLGRHDDFESSRRAPQDDGWARQFADYDDDARYGFDSRDYGSRDYGARPVSERDRGRWSSRQAENFDRWDTRYGNDDYSHNDYGNGYRNRSEYGAPYSGRSYYDEPRPMYGRGEIQRNVGYGETRGSGRYPAQSMDQGRIAASEYGRSQFSRRFGQAPKGYKRSDERVREDVCDRLCQDWDLDASDVEVSVSNGEVTLSGTVADRDQKFRVEHIADSVAGVNEVHNQLRVKREAPQQQSAAQPAQNKSSSNPYRSS